MRAAPALLLALASTVSAAGAADWPQWSGPRHDGTSPASGVFGPGPVRLREAWRRPAAGGISGLAAVGGRVFTLAADDKTELLLALDAASGRELWRAPLGPRRDADDEVSPVSTPASDGTLVFALGSDCLLRALAVADGKPAWQADLKERFNTGRLRNGCRTSPILDGDLLLVLASGDTDNRLVALAKGTGALVWSSKGVERTFDSSSPTVADLAGVRQVVVNDLDDKKFVSGLYGVRLSDGALLWSVRLDKGASFDTPFALPGDRIALATWNDLRVFGLRRDGEAFSAEPAWTSAEILGIAAPPVQHGGHVYGFGKDDLVCLEAATGKLVWKEKTYGGSLILVDGHLVALSHTAGLLRVAEASPAGYQEKARLEVFTPGANAYTPPSFAAGRILLRNAEEIVALEVAK